MGAVEQYVPSAFGFQQNRPHVDRLVVGHGRHAEFRGVCGVHNPIFFVGIIERVIDVRQVQRRFVSEQNWFYIKRVECYTISIDYNN